MARKVYVASLSMPNLYPEEVRWAKQEILPYFAFRNKSGTIACTKCNYKWKSNFEHQWMDEVVDDNHCPRCKVELKTVATTKRTRREEAHFSIVMVHRGFQVIRLFRITRYYKTTEKPRTYIWELGNFYIDERGKTQYVGHWQQNSWYSYGEWVGDWDLRHPYKAHEYDTIPDMYYPKMQILPILRRNGFRRSFHNLKPIALMVTLLTDNYAEMLYKVKQYALLVQYVKDPRPVERYKNAVKIAIRNNYLIKDHSIWFDYLGFLDYFGRDLSNAKYVCPKNLKHEHNRLMLKKRDRERKKHLKKEVELMRQRQKEYMSLKRKFMKLKFTSGKLVIAPFKSVKQLQDESFLLKHCAYESEYYKKKNSLMLSAQHDGRPVETIEVDIRKFELVQARGFDNDPSPYHKQIVKLVTDSMPQIHAVLNPKKSKNKKPMKKSA